MRTDRRHRQATCRLTRCIGELLEQRQLLASGSGIQTLYVDASAGGVVHDGTSWSTAYTSLLTAIAAATPGTQIRVAKGVYLPFGTGTNTFQLKNQVEIYGGYAGNALPQSPDIRDIALYTTELAGTAYWLPDPFQQTDYVVTSSGTDATAVLNGVTITFGALLNDHGSPTLQDCQTWTVINDASSASFTNCGIRRVTNSGASPTFTNCTFASASTSLYRGDGGAVANSNGSAPVFQNCTFIGYSAYAGGAVANRDSSATFVSCTFVRNRVDTYGLGGAIYATGATSSVSLTACRFLGNTAASGGTALYLDNGARADVRNSEFVGNAAANSCAVFLNGAQATFTNGTFAANSLAALSNLSGPAPAIRNSIFWGNALAGTTGTCDIAYSLVQDTSSGTGNITANPLFMRNPSPGVDGQWGTPDDDYGDLRLQSSSPAINVGDNAAPGLATLTTDISGAPRVAGGAVDMGAYEYDTPPTVTAVAINDGALQRSMVRKLAVVFSEAVTLSSNALTVKLSTGAVVPNTTVTVTNPSADQQTYLLTFSGSAIIGGSLPDGIYDLLISATGVQDLAGNALTANYSQRFHRLFGDSDGNKVVNALDYVRLKNTLGRASTDPLFNSSFDYEANNLINALDLARFRQRYGLSFSY